jgi:hypothetical protein
VTPRVDLRVLAPDLTTEVGVLEQARAIGWVDSLLDLGAGQFTIPHDAPEVQTTPALLDEGNVVQVRLDGSPVFAWEVERRRRPKGPVWDPVTVTGPGALNLLTHALVYAPRQQERLGSRQRVFGWMSIDYNDSAWTAPLPYSGGTQASPVRTNHNLQPEGWPDPLAEWVWSSAPDGFGNHPVGNSYFRLEIDVAANPSWAGPVKLYITADNAFVAYFDGERVADGQDWRGFAEVEIELVAGTTHVLAVEARNTRRSGGLLVSGFAVDEDAEDELGAVLFRTNLTSGWRSLDYPANVPGVTHGFVLETVFAEAQARGALPGISIDFDEFVDSDGEAWADEVEIVAQVGSDTVLTLAERMREWPVEFRMDPATFTWSAYQQAGTDRGQTPDAPATTVTIPVDRAGELALETEDETYDVLLVQTEFAWGETPSAPTGRREGFLSLAQSPTLSKALEQAERVRQVWATPREQVTFVTAAEGLPEPYTDYWVGDVLEGPLAPTMAAPWQLGDLRVDTIAVRITDGGQLEWVHQSVVRRLLDSVERLLTTRRALGDGTLGGVTTVPTSPVAAGRAGSASRQGGGSGAISDPRTITVEADDFEVAPGLGVGSIEWQRETSPTFYTTRFDATLPNTRLVIPSRAVWRSRIELEWDRSELPVPSLFADDWRGGGLVRFYYNGFLLWPIGEGETQSPPEVEGRHVRFGQTFPSLEMDDGDTVEFEITHDHADPHTMRHAVATVTLIEPFVGSGPDGPLPPRPSDPNEPTQDLVDQFPTPTASSCADPIDEHNVLAFRSTPLTQTGGSIASTTSEMDPASGQPPAAAYASNQQHSNGGSHDGLGPGPRGIYGEPNTRFRYARRFPDPDSAVVQRFTGLCNTQKRTWAAWCYPANFASTRPGDFNPMSQHIVGDYPSFGSAGPFGYPQIRREHQTVDSVQLMGTFRFHYFRNDGSVDVATPYIYPLGRWYFVVATEDPAEGVSRLFVNGQLAAEGHADAHSRNDTKVGIGAYSNNFGENTQGFDGWIGEAFAWLPTLSPQQVVDWSLGLMAASSQVE